MIANIVGGYTCLYFWLEEFDLCRPSDFQSTEPSQFACRPAENLWFLLVAYQNTETTNKLWNHKSKIKQ